MWATVMRLAAQRLYLRLSRPLRTQCALRYSRVRRMGFATRWARQNGYTSQAARERLLPILRAAYHFWGVHPFTAIALYARLDPVQCTKIKAALERGFDDAEIRRDVEIAWRKQAVVTDMQQLALTSGHRLTVA